MVTRAWTYSVSERLEFKGEAIFESLKSLFRLARFRSLITHKFEVLALFVFSGMDVYQVHAFFTPKRTMTKSPLPFGKIFWGRAETPNVLERHRRAC
jgi:hypothetical protein